MRSIRDVCKPLLLARIPYTNLNRDFCPVCNAKGGSIDPTLCMMLKSPHFLSWFFLKEQIFASIYLVHILYTDWRKNLCLFHRVSLRYNFLARAMFRFPCRTSVFMHSYSRFAYAYALS